MTRTKVLIGAIGLALVAAVAWAIGGGAGDPGGEALIARVDGVPITLAQAASRIDGIALVHAEDFDEVSWRPVILESLIDDVVVGREAARRGLAVTDEDVQETFEETRALFADPGSFDAWLDEQGIDGAELRRRMTLQLLGARVYAAVTADVRATDAEVEAHYAEHPERFTAHDGLRPLLEVRPDLEAELTKAAKDAAFAAWLAQQRAALSVEVLDDDWR